MKFFTLITAGLAALPFSLAFPAQPKVSDQWEGQSIDPLDEKHRLRSGTVVKGINQLRKSAEHIYSVTDGLKCGKEYRDCWRPVKDAIYGLERKLDLFDTKIDKSGFEPGWKEYEERRIYEAYYDYGYELIKVLELIAKKIEYLDGHTAKYIITAINSLRYADYAFVHEIGRRIWHLELVESIFLVQGTPDGCTKNSIREAFALFVDTPIIYGEDFEKVMGNLQNNPSVDIKVEEIKNKCKKFREEDDHCKEHGGCHEKPYYFYPGRTHPQPYYHNEHGYGQGYPHQKPQDQE